MMSPVVADYRNAKNFQEGRNDSDGILDSAIVMLDPELANIGGGHLDWDNPDIDFAEFFNPQMNEETDQYPLSGSSSMNSPPAPSTDQTIQVQQPIYSSSVSIPTLPTSTPRSLIQRAGLKAAAPRIANLILHTLKSYPLTMQRHKTLPPFIHPGSMSLNIESNEMEPLTNCINLVHMISSGVQGSRKLFWKNVRLECERFCDEVC
jgi:hypothetical protein